MLEAVLAAHPPIGFTTPDADRGDPLSVDELFDAVDAALHAHHESTERRDQQRAAEAQERFEAALHAADADTVIDDGRWAGFTRGRAIAWCWNLFEYEPHGFVSPGAQVRAEAIAELECGGIPVVFGYPERARQLETNGLTPQEYRSAKLALGATPFSPADVGTRIG